MRATYGTVSSRHTRLVFLGAVLMGCVFSLPGHAVAAGLTVEIIKPTTLPSFTFDTGTEYDFEAVSFAEGQELAGGEVTWEWDFGDGTAHVLTNPCKHTFANPGNWVVTVTARYGALDGQDTLNAAALPEGVAESIRFLVWPDTGDRVCDTTEVVLAVKGGLMMATFSKWEGDQWVDQPTSAFAYRQLGQDWYSTASCSWNTVPGTTNTDAVRWRVGFVLQFPPPDDGDTIDVFLTREASWTPYNTVLTGDSECLIEHSVGDASHTVEFTTAHLCDAAKGIDPKYHVTLTVYDLAGNQVARVTKDNVALGDGSITWEPEFVAPGADPPQPGQTVDSDAVYSYRLDADHGMCGDSWPKPLGGNVSGVYITSVLTNSYKAIVKYALARDLGEGELAAWKKNQDGWYKAGSIGLSGDGLKRGEHVTEPFTISGSPAEPVYEVLTGAELPDDGKSNRGGTAKPILPPGDHVTPISAIASVTWEAAYEGQLDANPAVGGGLRVFPDASAPGQPARPNVGVKVTLNVHMPGVPIHLKAFDVDDPSANQAPLDDEGQDADNRGDPKPGALQDTIVRSNDLGAAATTFAVTMQPGDNFRVAAQVFGDDALLTLRARQNDTSGRVTPGGGDTDGAGYALTPMLTVWRKLHLDCDTMRLPVDPENTIQGNATTVDTLEGGKAVITAGGGYMHDDKNRFEGGHLIQGENSFAVVANDGWKSNYTVTVTATAPLPQVSPPPFKLKDDDDDTTPLTPPSVKVLQDGLKPAYIEVVNDGCGALANNNSRVDFVANYIYGTQPWLDAEFPASERSQPAYWTQHVMAAFQGLTEDDRDPDSELGCWGISNGIHASIMREVMREDGKTDNSYPTILLHEVGHCFRLPDEYRSNLPSYRPENDGAMGNAGIYWFRDENLSVIRGCPCPGDRIFHQ